MGVWIKSEWIFNIAGENLEELKVEWKYQEYIMEIWNKKAMEIKLQNLMGFDDKIKRLSCSFSHYRGFIIQA